MWVLLKGTMLPLDRAADDSTIGPPVVLPSDTRQVDLNKRRLELKTVAQEGVPDQQAEAITDRLHKTYDAIIQDVPPPTRLGSVEAMINSGKPPQLKEAAAIMLAALDEQLNQLAVSAATSRLTRQLTGKGGVGPDLAAVARDINTLSPAAANKLLQDIEGNPTAYAVARNSHGGMLAMLAARGTLDDRGQAQEIGEPRYDDATRQVGFKAGNREVQLGLPPSGEKGPFSANVVTAKGSTENFQADAPQAAVRLAMEDATAAFVAGVDDAQLPTTTSAPPVPVVAQLHAPAAEPRLVQPQPLPEAPGPQPAAPVAPAGPAVPPSAAIKPPQNGLPPSPPLSPTIRQALLDLPRRMAPRPPPEGSNPAQAGVRLRVEEQRESGFLARTLASMASEYMENEDLRQFLARLPQSERPQIIRSLIGQDPIVREVFASRPDLNKEQIIERACPELMTHFQTDPY